MHERGTIPYLDLAPGLKAKSSWGHMTCTGFYYDQIEEGSDWNSYKESVLRLNQTTFPVNIGNST